jgi:hypothetical protein
MAIKEKIIDGTGPVDITTKLIGYDFNMRARDSIVG